jgi:hypothetical protein
VVRPPVLAPSAAGRSRSGEPATHRSAPSSDLSISSAWHSRAGPRARSRQASGAWGGVSWGGVSWAGVIWGEVSWLCARPGLRLERRARARSSPSMTAPARSRTADTLPSPEHTTFTQKCMP